MDGFDPAHSFGPEVAQRYDDQLRGDEAESVEFLANLAGGKSALELAIGTGRIALPLAGGAFASMESSCHRIWLLSSARSLVATSWT